MWLWRYLRDIYSKGIKVLKCASISAELVLVASCAITPLISVSPSIMCLRGLTTPTLVMVTVSWSTEFPEQEHNKFDINALVELVLN